MKRFWRPLVCNVFLAWVLTACSTPGTRGSAHPTALHRLSPGDRQLVLHGKIRPGMSAEAVYIAWGSPDDKIAGPGKSGSETWVYRQRVTILEPMSSYYYHGPYHGLGGGNPGSGFGPDHAYGGVGYEGTLRYQPHVRSLDSVRLAEFSGGKVDRYKGAGGTWSQPRQGISADPPTAPAFAAKPAEPEPARVARYVVHRDHLSGLTRYAVYHRSSRASIHRLAASSHQLHAAHHPGVGKIRQVQKAHADGQKADVERRVSSAHHTRNGVHGLGHDPLTCPLPARSKGRVTLAFAAAGRMGSVSLIRSIPRSQRSVTVVHSDTPSHRVARLILRLRQYSG